MRVDLVLFRIFENEVLVGKVVENTTGGIVGESYRIKFGSKSIF